MRWEGETDAMATQAPQVDQAITAGNSVFGWVARYGATTVFACVLLGYLLWSNYTVVAVVPSALATISQQSAKLADQQADIATILRQMQLTQCSGGH